MTEHPKPKNEYVERSPKRFLRRYYSGQEFELFLADARSLEPEALIEHLRSGIALTPEQQEDLADFLASRLRYLPEGRGPGLQAEKHRAVAIEAKARRKSDRSISAKKHARAIVVERYPNDGLNIDTIEDLIDGSSKRLHPAPRE